MFHAHHPAKLAFVPGPQVFEARARMFVTVLFCWSCVTAETFTEIQRCNFNPQKAVWMLSISFHIFLYLCISYDFPALTALILAGATSLWGRALLNGAEPKTTGNKEGETASRREVWVCCTWTTWTRSRYRLQPPNSHCLQLCNSHRLRAKICQRGRT